MSSSSIVYNRKILNLFKILFFPFEDMEIYLYTDFFSSPVKVHSRYLFGNPLPATKIFPRNASISLLDRSDKFSDREGFWAQSRLKNSFDE